MTHTIRAQQNTRHLDIGCGSCPRNPYGHGQLHGIDISAQLNAPPAIIKTANLALERIPYEDNFFDSVSAFDFIEHVPRILATADGRATRFPFIELMNECWRVLKPTGLFYAVTPCYPAAEAFQDPTHVNIISEKTHLYFTGNQPLGRMYGLQGRFQLIHADRIVFRDSLTPIQPFTVHQRVRHLNYKLKGKLCHLRWEFRAEK